MKPTVPSPVRYPPSGRLAVWLGVSVVAVDQLTKVWAVYTLAHPAGGTPTVLGGWLSLVLVTNNGAAFGILADRGILFILVGIVLSAVLLLYARLLPNRRPLLQASLGLQLGGAVSNLADRLRVGHVIDFIDVRYWPVFNVADSAIVCGVGLLVFYLLTNPGSDRGTPSRRAPTKNSTVSLERSPERGP